MKMLFFVPYIYDESQSHEYFIENLLYINTIMNSLSDDPLMYFNS